VLVASACHKSPVVTDRTVTAYVPKACAADGSAYAQYSAYGDFDPTAPPATGYLSDVGVVLPGIDDEARVLVMTASNDSLRAWEGVGSVPATGDVNVLVLPTLNSCALTQSVGPRTGSVMAPLGGEQVLIVGGTGNPTPSSYVARLDTGEVAVLSADLKTARTGASITGFASGALVAGGASDDGLLDTAEVYSTSAGGFDGQPFQLSEERTQHGAVVLANGRTLLVGGFGVGMAQVLASMEIVDPVTRTSKEEGVGILTVARSNATVLRLASGEILVAGGFDGTGAPVPSFEWFNPDATPAMGKSTLALPPGLVSTAIALEGGGALVVARTPAGTGFQNAWVIDASGTLEPAAPVPPPMASPVLFGGAEGAPVLWTGDRWLQWQPYGGSFGAISVLDDVPALVGDATCSPDPGLAMWLDPKQLQLTLLRFDTTNAYSSLPGPLLVTGTVTGPQETSPDRLTGAVWDTNMGLTLEPGAPGAAAFVTDRTYADVAISVDVAAGPAVVALRDTLGFETDVPGVLCGAPAPSLGGYTLQVERHGASVTWSTSTGLTGTCDLLTTGDARVSVGVRAGGTTQGIVTNLIVSRLGTP
jgi:hypothetical protein